ncbi:MAG: OsmC family protein [Thermoprotei archaeon]
MSANQSPKVYIELLHDYVFKVSFPDTKLGYIIMDEPAPLGNLEGPNASRVLAAAVGNCLSASLAFCLRKYKVNIKSIKTEVEPLVERNKEGYWRVTHINVKIAPEFEGNVDMSQFSRCLELFEKYCVVTGAVRSGIDVSVNVTAPKN